MGRGEQPSPERISHPTASYFELQAYVGTTKHMGGLQTTKELIALCHIGSRTYVLDVGCGVGATACYLARRHGCTVVGVDVLEAMVAASRERARKLGVEDRVEFRVADARELPFDDALFDTVICESVATFIEDKRRVAGECARVTRPGGYVGLNEEIWIKTPPAELAEQVKHLWEIHADIPTANEWAGMLQAAGLRSLVTRTYTFDARRESSQIRRYGLDDFVRMMYRTLILYGRDSGFRGYMRGRRRLPEGVFDYLGYGLFVGRK